MSPRAKKFASGSVVSATGDLPLKKTHQPQFGNEIYFAETSKAKAAELHFEVVYDVIRHEHLTLGLSCPRLEDASLSHKESKEFLGPDKLVPITGLPAELAAKATTDKSSQLDKARAIYDYVFANMSYEKTGTAPPRSPGITAGQNSLIPRTDGCLSTSLKPGSILRRKTITLAHMMQTGSSLLSAGI
jgi:transglutaminase-like putative cysteine protease